MSSTDIPADLIDLQRRFIEADVRCTEIAASHPRPTDVAAGRAEISAAQRQELGDARAVRLDIMRRLQGHDWWAGQGNRFEARQALIAAARER